MSVTSRCRSIGLSVNFFLSVNFCELSVGQWSVGEWSCYRAKSMAVQQHRI